MPWIKDSDIKKVRALFKRLGYEIKDMNGSFSTMTVTVEKVLK